MASSSILRRIDTYGNYALVAKDTPLWTKAGSKHMHYNVLPGQLVAYFTNRNGTIPLAIEAADITAANVHRLRIGVGWSTDGRTVTDIRHLGVEELGNCDLEHASTASPRCGSPMVVDYYFNCVTCYDNYVLSVGVDDNFTRSHAPLQKSFLEHLGGFTPNCSTCEGCDTPVTCDEIVNGLVASIRGGKAPSIQGVPYPDYKQGEVEQPFGITKLHPRSLTYCIGFTEPETECEDCELVSAITEVTIDDVEYTLVGTTIPGDVTQTARVQLDSVVNQINDLIETHLGPDMGYAYLTGVGPSNCCPLQLHVNINDATFAIPDIKPVADASPFAPGTPGEGFTCGFRAIAAPLTGECGCIVDKEPATYNRTIFIKGYEGFQDGRMAVIQQGEMPGQFGASIQNRSLYQTRGGEGRTYSAGYSGDTWNGVPRKDSLLWNASTVDCKKDYCSYYLRSKWYFDNPGSNQTNFQRLDSFVDVPSGDAATITAVQALLTAYAAVSTSCQDAPVLTCAPLGGSCPPEE